MSGSARQDYASWRAMERVVAVYAGVDARCASLIPALRSLREALPGALLWLLRPAALEAAPEIAGLVEQDIGYPCPDDVEGSEAASAADAVVATLAEAGCAAAIVLTDEGESSHGPAYLCYLAGIPSRIGFSSEFGGGVLTLSVDPPPLHGAARHLALLEAAGLPTSSLTRARTQTQAEIADWRRECVR